MNKEHYKTKLEEEKKLLEEELNDLGKVDKMGDWKATPEEENSKSQDVQDEADITERAEEYEERSSQLNLLEKRLSDIKKALEKIEMGDYGICEVCGKEIEEDRLEANGAALTCKEHMNKVI